MMVKTGTALLFGVSLAGLAEAQDSDLVEGEKLYRSQCQLCHGSVAAPVGKSEPAVSPMRLAMRPNTDSTMLDAQPLFDFESSVIASPRHVAVAMPFGPHLRGVVGRPAGTVEGYSYSATLLKTLKGMEWNEAALNVWITDPQAWVPGVFMFYKQRDAEVRRKIILYLKANS